VVTVASDEGLLAVGGVGLLAVIALAVSLLRDDGDRVINIPSDFGQSGGGYSPGPGQTVDEDTPGATPSDPDNDGDTEWQVPDNVEQGGGDGSLWAGEGTGFNPEQRTDLINDPSTVDGEEQEHTWVGL
jgi:hypothetical protein